jgi:hypothetical protein
MLAIEAQVKILEARAALKQAGMLPGQVTA